MAKYGPDAMVRAAEECMNREDWRTAFGYWKQLITQYSKSASEEQIKYWEMKMNDCRERMKAIPSGC